MSPNEFPSYLDWQYRNHPTMQKQKIIIHIACLRREFEKLMNFLPDKKPVFLIILDTVKYKNDIHENKIMIKLMIKKGE